MFGTHNTKSIKNTTYEEISFEETSTSSLSSQSESHVPEQKSKYCCGEGYLLLEDETGSHFRFRLVSEPNPQTLTETVENIIREIRSWFQRPTPVSIVEVSSLGILCANSAVTVLASNTASGLQQGVFIGNSALPALSAIFNAFKTRPFLHVQPLSSRLLTGDLLLLNIVLGITEHAGEPGPDNPVLASLTLSGQYHIVGCGAQLCIDTLTAYLNSFRQL